MVILPRPPVAPSVICLTIVERSDIIFIAVNTPTKTSGEGKGMAADLSNIKKCTVSGD